MFLKRLERRKGRKKHTYWALVESIRTAKGSRHRVVAYLGDLKKNERNGWASLGCRLDKKDRPHPSLFDPPPYPEPADDVELVRIKGIRLERPRDFGDVWLALGLWRLLGLDTLLSRVIPAGKEDVPWPTVAAILTVARLCEPSSELHIEDTWYRRTSLEDLLGVAVEQVHTDRLYAGLDQLLPHKQTIEKHLKERLGDLFDLKYDLLLYDITSTYFEGQCLGNPMAQRGYSRDSRPDCKQVCIGLVVTTDGIPLGYEVFDGNTGDSTTVETIVAAMEAKYGRASRVWVMDRGMVSEKNLEFLRREGRRYLVGTPKALLKKYEQHLLSDDWHTIREGIEVKLLSVPRDEDDETPADSEAGDGADDEHKELFILCRSQDRVRKDEAIVRRFEQRIEERLRAMAARCQKQRRDPRKLEREIGRMLGQNTRAARLFEVTVEQREDGGAQLKWRKIEGVRDWAALSAGCYLLRTNVLDWTDEELWKTYMQLTEAEAAFKIQKSDLSIRPIWHQKEERVLAHILVCFLAYVLWKTLGQLCRQAGVGDEPRRVLDELAEVRLMDVVLPTREGIEIRQRCVARPTEHQQILLDRLRLRLPARLKPRGPIP